MLGKAGGAGGDGEANLWGGRGKPTKKIGNFGWEKGGGRVGGGLKSKRERKDGGEN